MTASAPPPSQPHRLAALASTAPVSGALRTALLLAVTLVAGLATWHAFSESTQRIDYPDAYDYAQMGRQLARGEGMTSLQIFPYALGRLERAGLETAAPWPIMWRFPLPVLVRAASFRLLGETQGASDFAALLPALLFSVLTATLLFALANELGGPTAGLLAAAIWIASASQRWLAVTGLTEPGAALLAVAIAWLALRAASRATPASAAVLGAVLGLAVLHRSNLLALAPVAAWMVWRAAAQQRPARLMALGFAALLVAAPWWIRNQLMFGEPLLNLTTERGLLRLALGEDPFFTLGNAGAEGRALRDSLVQFPGLWTFAWLQGAGPLMLGRDFAWLFAASAVLLPIDLWRGRTSSSLWVMALGGLVLTALVFAPIYPQVVRFYWPYAPLLLALVCASGCAELGRSRWASQPSLFAGIALAALCVFALAAPRDRVAPVMPASRSGLELHDLARLGSGIARDSVIASDVSYAVAWQAEQPSIRIMGNYDVVAEIDARILPLRTIHVALDLLAAAPLDAPPLSEKYERVADDPKSGRLYVARPATPAAR